MAFFDFIENFFFISLGITFGLILLLVYHFKQRISTMERKGDTMYELMTNVVKELQIMKKLNAYYESLFSCGGSSSDESSQPELTNEEPPVKINKPSSTINDPIQIILNETAKNETPKLEPTPPLSDNVQNGSVTSNRIVVSDDESDSSSEDDESDSDSGSDIEVGDSDSGSEDDDCGSDSDNESETNNVDESSSHVEQEVDPTILNTQSFNEFTSIIEDAEIVMVEDIDILGEPQSVSLVSFCEENKEEPSISIEDIQITDLELSPNVSDESTPKTDSYEPNSVQSMENQLQPVNDPEVPREEEELVTRVETSEKKQTREVYRKMNITQLRSIATVSGISVDTSKMKKNDLIQLLESLEE